MDKEEMKIDFVELQNQRKKEIIRSGKYVAIEIVVGENEKMPIAQIDVRKVTSEEIAITMATLREILTNLAKIDPCAYKIYTKIKSGPSKLKQIKDEEDIT